MKFPMPVIDVAIEPKTKADQDKLAIALQKLTEEDPTFRGDTDEETSQTITSGMGELHLEQIMNVEAVCPNDYMGDILGDLSSR